MTERTIDDLLKWVDDVHTHLATLGSHLPSSREREAIRAILEQHQVQHKWESIFEEGMTEEELATTPITIDEMLEAVDGLLTIENEKYARTLEAIRAILEQHREQSDNAGVIASCADLLNSWARESGVAECDYPFKEGCLQSLIDRLWSVTSTHRESLRRIQRLQETIDNRTALEAIRAFVERVEKRWSAGLETDRDCVLRELAAQTATMHFPFPPQEELTEDQIRQVEQYLRNKYDLK